MQEGVAACGGDVGARWPGEGLHQGGGGQARGEGGEGRQARQARQARVVSKPGNSGNAWDGQAWPEEGDLGCAAFLMLL